MVLALFSSLCLAASDIGPAEPLPPAVPTDGGTSSATEAPVPPVAGNLPVASGPELTPTVRPSAVAPLLRAEEAFPRPSPGRFLLDSGKTMLRPFCPQRSDLWVLGGAAVLAALAIPFDVAIHREVSRIPNPELFGARVAGWGSYLGEGWIDLLLVLAAGTLGGRDGARVAWAGLEALIAVAVVSRVGKLAFRLERPSYDPEAQHWFSRPTADAMPSGHAMSAFATAAVLAEQWPKLSPLFYGLAAYVGLARIQEHTHWASDVVVGAALGTLLGLEAFRLTRRFELEVQPWTGPDGAGVQVSSRF